MNSSLVYNTSAVHVQESANTSLEFYKEPYYSIRNIINWSIIGLIIVSLFGNALIIVVMSMRHNRKSSTAVFFIALAVSDMVLVMLLPFERWLHWATKESIYSVNHKLTVLKTILNYSVFHLSSWILVCVTIERVVSVIVPHKVKTICTLKTASLMVTVTGFIIFAVNTAAFTLLVDIIYDEQTGPNWANKVSNGRTIIQWWDLCVAFVLPFIIISVGSVVIITQLLRVSVQKHGTNVNKNNPVTRKLLAANAVFIVTMSPFCIFSYSLTTSNGFDVDPEIIWLISDSLLFLSDLNAALNFFVYCLTGTRFRSDVLKVLYCK